MLPHCGLHAICCYGCLKPASACVRHTHFLWHCTDKCLHRTARCRDHVLRLLEGLLAVQGRRLIRAEAAMGEGRADMVLLGAAGLGGGPPLLVVEFKRLASEAGRSQRDRNAGQLQRYLQDKVAGCREGLLVTFDTCLVNGLSAVRVVGVERAAWARLLGDRPEHAPRFTSQPCPHLERCAWALGAMAGICAQHGVAVGEQAGG